MPLRDAEENVKTDLQEVRAAEAPGAAFCFGSSPLPWREGGLGLLPEGLGGVGLCFSTQGRVEIVPDCRE